MNVFLEGSSFTGKTTLLRALKAMNESLAIIDEHDVYAKGIDNYPPFPSESEHAARENVDFFFNLERQRHQDAMGASISVFDRSIFSVILFQKFIASLHRSDHANAYAYSKTEALRLIRNGSVSIPDALVYVNADYETIAGRYGREISVGLLRGRDAFAFFQEQYAAVSAVYERQNLLQSVTSSDNTNAVKEQAALINDQIDAWSLSTIPTDISSRMAEEVIGVL